MIAANKGKSDEVEFLVAHGADVNATTTGGCTALMFASEKGHLGIVDFLLAHSAQVNIASSKVRMTHDTRHTTHDTRHTTRHELMDVRVSCVVCVVFRGGRR